MKAGIYFTTIFLVYLICVCSGVASKGKLKSGPYRVILKRSENCKKPSRPYMHNPGFIYHGDIYNTSKKQFLLRGNITVLRENSNLVIKQRTFLWEDGKWKFVYTVNGVGYKSRWLVTIMIFFGMKFNNCSVAKGVYSFEDVDENQVEHLLTSTREYGKLLMKWETFYQGKTELCVEVETEAVPI